jgi:hypothetical protein
MSIENRRQCDNTRAKMQELEQLYEKKRQELGDEHVRELTLRSLKKRINQFKEEIARYEAHAGSPAPGGIS